MKRLTKKDFQDRIDASLKFNGAAGVKVKILGSIPENLKEEHARLKCSIHGEFTKNLNLIPRTPREHYLICATCSRLSSGKVRASSTKEIFLKELKNSHNGTLLLVGDYVNKKTKAKFKCTVCNHISSCLPHSKLKHGCAVCANAKRQHKHGEKVEISGKEFRLEGFEKPALKYLFRATDLKPSQVLCASSGEVPSIEYEFKDDGKFSYTYFYHPDFFVPKTKTLYEVKSTLTLGIHTPNIYRKNRAKAKACVALGYKHVLVLVIPKQGSVMVEGWYKKSLKSFLQMLREEYLLRL